MPMGTPRLISAAQAPAARPAAAVSVAQQPHRLGQRSRDIAHLVLHSLVAVQRLMAVA
jgi:hypothetical protein